jgi:hypothetical protein
MFSKLREAISPWLEAMSLDTDLVLETCKNALSTAELQGGLHGRVFNVCKLFFVCFIYAIEIAL